MRLRTILSLSALLLATAAPAGALPPTAGPGGFAAPTSTGGLRDRVRGAIWSLATVFTNAGAAIVTNRIIQAGTAPKNIGWGTGTTAAAVTDTALQTENAPTTAGGRTVGTESRVTTTNTNDTYQVVGTVTATLAGPTAQTESGLFDNVTAGNMLIHSVFSAINVSAADSIAFTFGLKFVPA